MKRKWRDLRVLLPGLSMALLSVATLSRWSYWLTLFGLVPLVLFCASSKNLQSKVIMRAIYWPGYLYGLATYAWVMQTTPNSWTALQGGMAIFGKVAAWLLAAFSVSIGFWLLSKFVVRYHSKTLFLLVGLPVAWGVSELIRVYMFSLIGYGPGASLSPNWNMGILGMSLMPTPLSYLSRFVGMYGMSMVAVAINIALYVAIFRQKYKIAGLIVLPVVVFSALGYILYQPNGREVRVAAVHLETKESLDNWPEAKLPPKDSEVVVLPEYSLFFQKPNYHAFAKQYFEPHTTIVTSVASNDKPSRNTLTAYQPARGIFSQQDKTFIIAGGEFMPYVFSGVFSAINQSYLTKAFNDSQQVKPGIQPELPIQTSNLLLGSLVCSGVAALNEYRGITHKGAEILTNSASLSLIASASLFHEQATHLTQFHAIANARPFVQSSRSGESYILSANGKRLVETKGNTKAIATVVRSSNKKTLYSTIGEWTLVVGPLLLVWSRRNIFSGN